MDVDVVDADVTSREEGERREFTTTTTKRSQQQRECRHHPQPTEWLSTH